MVGMMDFFGSDEWGAMFIASMLLTAVTIFFLLSRIVLWIAFALFFIAFLFTGYKVFFDKKNKNKGDIADFGSTMKDMFKK